jgi:ADP-ribosylglycohydrolase
MCGGGGWEPGEATDDTQMAVHVAESLLERGGLELPDVFARFRRWARAEPKDIGLQTEDVLTNGLPWDRAAQEHFRTNHRAAGNGALMRAGTSGVYFAGRGQAATEFNGAVWPCLGSAVWAVRTTGSFEEAVRAAVDLGGDTDTVAAVTGALAGAVYGVGAVPARWAEALHVPLPGAADPRRVLRLPELLDLADRLGSV